MAEVASAYVTLIPHFKDLSGYIEGALGGTKATSSAAAAGSKAASSFASSFAGGAIMGAVSSVVSSAMGAISSSLGSAIARVDTMNNFPRVMESLGFSADTAQGSIDRMASRILGMGDVLTLIEKAEQALDQKKAAELEQKMRANKFTLADFYDQLLQIRKMGPMQDLLGMIPGMGSMKNVQVDESALGRVEAIILSMTPYERENPACLNSSRKRRIALGCGQKVEDVNRLLKQFDQMQQLMKQMNGKGKKRKLPGKMGGFPGFPGM